MRLVIEEFSPDDRGSARSVAILTGQLCRAQGMAEEQIDTYAETAGQYAAEVIFAAMRRTGTIPKEGINTADFITAAEEITTASIESPRLF